MVLYQYQILSRTARSNVVILPFSLSVIKSAILKHQESSPTSTTISLDRQSSSTF